jgi:hypothetical protein
MSDSTTAVKADLIVVLKANDMVVAEVKDAALWQRILAVINGVKADLGAAAVTDPPSKDLRTPGVDLGKDTSPLDLLAQQVGIDPTLVQGACSPVTEAPHMHLDPHYWEVMRRQLPARGLGAVAPIVVSATLLALWFQKAGLGNPTQAQAKAVLSTINISDPNASRSIQNASWLQSRAGGQVVLNPAEISRAVKLAKCFCSKDWSLWKEAANG